MRDPDRRKKLIRVIFLSIVDVLLACFVQIFSLALRFEFQFQLMAASEHMGNLLAFLPVYLIMVLLFFRLAGLYSSLWEFAGLEEAIRIIAASALVSIVQFCVMLVLKRRIPRSFPFLNAVFLSLAIGIVRYSYRIARSMLRQPQGLRRARTMLVGAGAAASVALKDLSEADTSRNRVVCIIDDDPLKQGQRMRGVPVVGGRKDIPAMVRRYQVEQIILAIPSATASQLRELTSICQDTGCETKILPSITQIASGRLDIRAIRKVQIEDLLGRDSVSVNLEEIASYVEGKVVLVTGGGGSIGSELCRQLAAHHPSRLLIFDISENGAYAIQQELAHTHPALRVEVLIGSIRDAARLDSVFDTYRPQIVYHAAAHKHVPLMEENPREAVKNNVFGTRNLCEAADRFGAEIFVQISTDKAVNPTNVMGATKRICEMLVQSFSRRSDTKFVCVRFGNVLGSSGSVIPLFRRQIEQGGPVTVTHKDIIRYFMTIPEAVSLVLQAGAYASDGEIFVLDMGEPVRIDDLARNMIRLSGYEPDVDMEVRYVGLRPGEKLYEELLLDEEGIRSTANQLIHIGKPLEIDEDGFRSQLAALEVLCHQPDGDVRPLLREIVPTYQPENGGVVPAGVH